MKDTELDIQDVELPRESSQGKIIRSVDQCFMLRKNEVKLNPL